MQKKKYLTTGEFAKLCRTTKETLFHYDRENLLKPRYVSENGYRRYGMEQYFDFDMISTLKETGTSLKEIRHYMHKADSAEFLLLLEEKTRVVKQERAKLAQRETMLREMAVLTREALSMDYDVISIREEAEERLEILPTTPASSESVEESVEEFVARFTEYIDFYDTQGRNPLPPFGAIIMREEVRQNRYAERYFFSRATRATPHSQVHIKPEGRYAVYAHKGTMQTHFSTYHEILRKLAEKGERVAGNAYIYDLMSYILLGTGGSYAAKYCIRIE